MAAAETAPIGLTGGCQCGAVRYRLDAAPSGSNICHCRMCQKAGGAPFMAFTRRSDRKIRRHAGRIASFASSDIAERGFCADCGTPLTYRGLGASACQRDDRQPRRSQRRRARRPARRRIAGPLARGRAGAARDAHRDWLARKKIAAIAALASIPTTNQRTRSRRLIWPTLSFTITSAPRAGAASLTVRCIPPRRCISRRRR